jgi:hypothetical protein
VLAALTGASPAADRQATPRPAGDIPGERLVARILAEYREMPGLNPTVDQAARLWGVDPASCTAVLEALVAAGRLRCTRERRYCLPGTIERVWRSAR